MVYQGVSCELSSDWSELDNYVGVSVKNKTKTIAYETSKEAKDDWCVLTLSAPIEGVGVSYFDCEMIADTAAMNGKEITVAGYPASHSGKMQKSSGIIVRTWEDGEIFDHLASALGGNSGGPVFDSETNKCYGILCGEIQYISAGAISTYNYGHWFTWDVYNSMLDAIIAAR